MEHDPPIAAPDPRERMVITGGYVPELWRWRVARITARHLVLAGDSREVRIDPDMWLPFLAARCRMDPVYIDGTRILPPAAAPLWLEGETPIEALTAIRPPRHNRLAPLPPVADLAVRLNQARFLLIYARIKAGSLFGEGTIVTFAERGSEPACSVTYDIRDGSGPWCSCQPVERRHHDAYACAHSLAALLRDPQAVSMLARVLSAAPPKPKTLIRQPRTP